MRRPLIALAAGIAITVPAAVGLLGNASFAQRQPLTSPTSASTTTHPTPSPTVDDHGGNRPAGVSDDPPGDDHGGDRPRTGDDNSGSGSDSSGHGSDDSSADDSGGHGSDD